MIGRAIAERYAKVFYDLNMPRKILEKGLAELNTFLFILEKQPRFAAFLKAPQIDPKEKHKILKKTFGGRFEESLINFIAYLIEKKRLGYLNQILKEYGYLVDEHLGLWKAELTTAVPLNEEMENKLRQKLEEVYKKKIVIHTEIDPEIIGGAILIVANEMADWSVKGRLKSLKEGLLDTRGVKGT